MTSYAEISSFALFSTCIFVTIPTEVGEFMLPIRIARQFPTVQSLLAIWKRAAENSQRFRLEPVCALVDVVWRANVRYDSASRSVVLVNDRPLSAKFCPGQTIITATTTTNAHLHVGCPTFMMNRAAAVTILSATTPTCTTRQLVTRLTRAHGVAAATTNYPRGSPYMGWRAFLPFSPPSLLRPPPFNLRGPVATVVLLV